MFSPELWATKRLENLGRLMIAKTERIAEGRKATLGEWIELNSAAFGASLTETFARRGSDGRLTYDTPELRAASVFTEDRHKVKNMTDVSYEVAAFLAFIPGGVVNLPYALFSGMFDRKSIRPAGMSASRAEEMLNDPQGVGHDEMYAVAGDEPTEEEMRNYAIGPAQDWEVFWRSKTPGKSNPKPVA